MARTPGKEKFHSEASDDVQEKLADVINRHHFRLKRSRFLILFKHGGWESKGKTVFGKAKVLADDLRRLLKKDGIIYLNADMWSMLSSPQKDYVLDHTLFTLDVKRDNDGNVKEAADGRPLLSIVPPDIEGFADVIRRHGVIMEDVKRLARALTETNAQLTIEDAAAEAPPEEPREGLRGIIDTDGTATVTSASSGEEDENQLKLTDDGAVAVGSAANDDPMHDLEE